MEPSLQVLVHPLPWSMINSGTQISSTYQKKGSTSGGELQRSSSCVSLNCCWTVSTITDTMHLFNKTTFIHVVCCLHPKPVLPFTGTCKESSARAAGFLSSRSHGIACVVSTIARTAAFQERTSLERPYCVNCIIAGIRAGNAQCLTAC